MIDRSGKITFISIHYLREWFIINRIESRQSIIETCKQHKIKGFLLVWKSDIIMLALPLTFVTKKREEEKRDYLEIGKAYPVLILVILCLFHSRFEVDVCCC